MLPKDILLSKYQKFQKDITKQVKKSKTKLVLKVIKRKDPNDIQATKKLDVKQTALGIIQQALKKYDNDELFELLGLKEPIQVDGRIMNQEMDSTIQKHIQQFDRTILGIRLPKKPKQKQPKQIQEKEPEVTDEDRYSDVSSEIELAERAPLKKNRMGQRARRMLWEKQYGENANHIIKTKKEEKKKEEEKQKKEKLHPSWEAKKREQEKMKVRMEAKPTKIVFDD